MVYYWKWVGKGFLTDNTSCVKLVHNTTVDRKLIEIAQLQQEFSSLLQSLYNHGVANVWLWLILWKKLLETLKSSLIR